MWRGPKTTSPPSTRGGRQVQVQHAAAASPDFGVFHPALGFFPAPFPLPFPLGECEMEKLNPFHTFLMSALQGVLSLHQTKLPRVPAVCGQLLPPLAAAMLCQLLGTPAAEFFSVLLPSQSAPPRDTSSLCRLQASPDLAGAGSIVAFSAIFSAITPPISLNDHEPSGPESRTFPSSK